MNPAIEALFYGYLRVAGDDKPTAAVLVLADVLSRPTPEPIIIEPDDRHTLGVKEAAVRLGMNSKKVYQMCLAGKLRCVRIGGRVRIPVEEIQRYEND